MHQVGSIYKRLYKDSGSTKHKTHSHRNFVARGKSCDHSGMEPQPSSPFMALGHKSEEVCAYLLAVTAHNLALAKTTSNAKSSSWRPEEEERKFEVLNSAVIYAVVFWDKAQCYVGAGGGYQRLVRNHCTSLRTGSYPVSFYERISVYLAVIIVIVITIIIIQTVP